MRFLRNVALVSTLAVGALAMAAAPTTKPAEAKAGATTKPAVDAKGEAKADATTKPSVSPAAQAELDKMKQAYGKLNSLDLVGKLSMNFDVMGQKQTKNAEFTSSYQSPNKFKQEVKDDVLAGSTGEKLYLYSKDQNVYLMQDAPKGKVGPGELPDPYSQVVGTQNPSLMMALSADPGKSVTENLSHGEQLEDVKLEDKSYTALKFSDPTSKANMTLLVDPTTHLVRRATLDMVESLKQRGATDVKSAEVQVDYSSVKPDAKVEKDTFAWDPPKDAKDAKAQAAAAAQEGGDPSAELKGKAAPDFTAKNLKDETVTLSKDGKGSVVIVDFWATWCPPCREGLPHVDKVYQEFKDKGVKAYAVDVQETKDKVAKYMEEQKLTLTALLDSDGKISTAYKVNGIPQTVIIGKDGKVREVFVGTGPDSEQKLHAAVKAAVEEK